MNTLSTENARGSQIERGQAMTKLVEAREKQLRADEWVVKRVQEARAIGCSWSDIAEVFGITRSATYQRYGHLPPVGWIEK